MGGFIFVLCSVLFSLLLYMLHPSFYDWNLFTAIRNESHDFSHAMISVFYVFLVSIPVAFIRPGLYSVFNACLLFTVFIPFFSLMPYYTPEYVFSDVSYLAVSVSVMFSLLGVLWGGKFLRIDWSGFGYIKPRHFLVFVVLVNFINMALVVYAFRGVISFNVIGNIYAQREIYTESANIFSYFVNWQFMVFSPLLLLLSMIRLRVDLFALALVGFFLVFSITAFKVALAVPFLMVVGFLTSRFWRSRVSACFVSFLFLVMVIFAFLFDSWSESKYLSALLVDRTVYAHGVTSLFIIEMFSEMPFVYWSNSFLRHIVEPVYSVDPFIMVGYEYWGKFARANTGFFGDGFINAGWGGVFASALVAASVLGGAQSLLEKKYGHYAYLIFLPHIVAMLNGPIQVSLMTNGLLVLLALSLVSPVFNRESAL
ncbi:hypothetical protein [Pseudomonas sp. BN515]|uniref:hypothetical protein n=1 Tax=Pseudomonas sp. BN515 TaxID=2567892 RepID=UPI0024553ADF|nr:hypothetical protein [Pseudomonas sp. BN515]MDH4870504.1 hypothetical protein [Pseudomonas sp. BN515]